MRALLAALIVATPAFAKDPECGHPDNWAANLALSRIMDTGLARREQLDFEKTQVARLASQKIGRDLYRQVHLVTFHRKDGSVVKIITVSDASSEECSMGDVTMYPVSDFPQP